MSPPSRTVVSGSYRGARGAFEVELRVDVDGARPMNRVSADYFRLQRDGPVYVGSMCVDAPALSSSAAGLTISGVARSTWRTDANDVRVTIPQSRPGAPPAGATLRHLTRSGQVRASYECAYASAAFRRVVL